jgi:hypothetical protein
LRQEQERRGIVGKKEKRRGELGTLGRDEDIAGREE